MPSLNAELYVLGRISAPDNARKTIPIDPLAVNKPNHVLIPFFDGGLPYYDILNGPYVKTPENVSVAFAGAAPTPHEYFAAADAFVRFKFKGYELNEPMGIGTSYWDGNRWIPLGGHVAYAYPMRKTGSAFQAVERNLSVDDTGGAQVDLVLHFLAVIQH